MTYTTAYSNAESLTHCARPEIEPETSWFLVGFVSAVPQQELLGEKIVNRTQCSCFLPQVARLECKTLCVANNLCNWWFFGYDFAYWSPWEKHNQFPDENTYVDFDTAVFILLMSSCKIRFVTLRCSWFSSLMCIFSPGSIWTLKTDKVKSAWERLACHFVTGT